MLTTTINIYRNAYSGLSRSTWLLSLIMLINRSGTMVVPFMTLYLTSPEMGYSVGEAGVVFGLFGAGAFCGAWLGGRITDKIGFYPVQLFTLITGGILFIVLGYMKSYPAICFFTFLLSFVNEAFRPANSTAIAYYSSENNRTRSYAVNRLAINIGWAVGSATGGFLAEIDYQLLFWVDGFTNIGAAVLLWFLLKPVVKQPVVTEKTVQPVRTNIYKDKTYLWFTLFTMLFACCFFQLFNNLPVYFKKDLDFSKPFIGLLMAANGIIIAFFEMILIYKLETKNKNNYYIFLGVFLVGFSFLLLNIPFNATFIACLMILIVTFGEILSMPFMNTYWINRTHAGNRGQYAALYTMAWSAAQTLGPMSGALLADHAGFHVLWWTVGGLCIFSAFCFSWLFNKPAANT